MFDIRIISEKLEDEEVSTKMPTIPEIGDSITFYFHSKRMTLTVVKRDFRLTELTNSLYAIVLQCD